MLNAPSISSAAGSKSTSSASSTSSSRSPFSSLHIMPSYTYPIERHSSQVRPEETGQRLLSMLNDMMPMVDQDPQLSTIMQDVQRLVSGYQ